MLTSYGSFQCSSRLGIWGMGFALNLGLSVLRERLCGSSYGSDENDISSELNCSVL